jgi:hypothetical protein
MPTVISFAAPAASPSFAGISDACDESSELMSY